MNMGGGNFGQSGDGGNGNFNRTEKKIPNPGNYKIVKCKNFERGKFFYFYLF